MPRPAAATVVGIGATAFGHRSGRSVPALASEAALNALADAGLGPSDIDAVVPVGGACFAEDLIANIRVRPTVFDALPPPGGNSGVVSLGVAEALITAGRADVAVIVFARNGSSASRVTARVRALPGQWLRTYLEQPHGWIAPVQWYSMIARRHTIEYGSRRRPWRRWH